MASDVPLTDLFVSPKCRIDYLRSARDEFQQLGATLPNSDSTSPIGELRINLSGFDDEKRPSLEIIASPRKNYRDKPKGEKIAHYLQAAAKPDPYFFIYSTNCQSEELPAAFRLPSGTAKGPYAKPYDESLEMLQQEGLIRPELAKRVMHVASMMMGSPDLVQTPSAGTEVQSLLSLPVDEMKRQIANAMHSYFRGEERDAVHGGKK